MVDVDPTWINASGGVPAYAASELRRTEAVLMFGGVADRLGARQGVRPGADAVSLAGTTVTVHNVPAVVYPAVTSISGAYRVALLETNHELNPADGTNPRKDIVVCQVQDHDEDASGFRRARSFVVAGTPGATPVEPEVPAGSFRLATVTVPQSGGGGATLEVNTPFAVASGGVLPVRTAGELPTDGLYEGMTAFQQDGDNLVIWDGAAWQPTASTKAPNQQRYTASTTWSKPLGLKYAVVEVQGGGGAGGGAQATGAGQSSAGAGGQGGAYARTTFAASALGASEQVTVGAGGGGVSGGGGNAGGTSSFGASGTLVSAAGGAGGSAIATSASTGFGHGADSTQAITGQIQIPGGGGGPMGRGGLQGCVGGMGGPSQLGKGGGGRGGPSSTGFAGKQYGGGGGGATCVENSTARTGGAGGAGIVIVTEYF
ncbi:hypothetical protein [Amycolatopsis palatopharyngis]|uniref:glycine-rich domain-containing protein n=1 Tax=Amycolatopsis palatopharyngis TaxID=187982 RepID=UPI000E2733F6|nr:hypothetical protein [Amycolatopsis palatopharyngis]